MAFPIIPQNLSVSAMRSSGYKDTAHALAELIDNSIQAGQETGAPARVEVVCVEQPTPGNGRLRTSKIAVLDNASGMTPKTLRLALQFGNGTRLESAKHTGIGKFGMGLPNSSISQCERVDVWSWRDGLTVHSYLDVLEMQKGLQTEVPEPQPSTIPSEWLKLFVNGIANSGTLVVWSRLDRVTWTQSSTLLRHVEFLAGRVYRRFINDKSVRIRLAAYEFGDGSYTSKWESFVRPNDPLYLMTGTSAPAPYDQRPAFEPWATGKELSVSYQGTVHKVSIRAATARPEIRSPGGGAKPIGKHAKRNQGVSVVRAGRELEMNKSFEAPDFRERWWGIEVDFPPALDDLFGVTNNKQSATAFQHMSLEEDADSEDMDTSAYQRMLEQEGDPRLPMYRITREVNKFIRQMRQHVLKIREAESVASGAETLSKKIEKAATASVRKRRERIGNTGQSDRQEDESDEVRTKSLTDSIVDDGIEPAQARIMAVDYVKSHTKFRVRHAALPTSAMFDISAAGGVIVLTFNLRHATHGKIFSEFQQTEETSPLAREVLSLLIAWARMEDEASSPQIKTSMEETREAWGRMAKDFFEPDET